MLVEIRKVNVEINICLARSMFGVVNRKLDFSSLSVSVKMKLLN